MNIRIVILFLFVSTFTFAQKEKIRRLQHFDKSKIRYGFYLGTHQKAYSVILNPRTNSPVNITTGLGFQLGILADYNLTPNASILVEPGVISSSNQLAFGSKVTEFNNTYFTLPVSLKLTTDRINNLRFYGTGGLSINYNFNASDYVVGSDHDFELQKTTLNAEISLGMNIYLPYFKLSPAIKGVYGLRNELQGTNRGQIASTQGPADIRSRAIFLSLTFQ